MEHASRPLHRRLRPRTSPPRAASLASALVVVAWFLAPTALARDFYVDPETGSPDNDGSAEHPWRTLEEVIAATPIDGDYGIGHTRWASLGDSTRRLLKASGATVTAESPT